MLGPGIPDFLGCDMKISNKLSKAGISALGIILIILLILFLCGGYGFGGDTITDLVA